jgi:hypothetical protein
MRTFFVSFMAVFVFMVEFDDSGKAVRVIINPNTPNERKVDFPNPGVTAVVEGAAAQPRPSPSGLRPEAERATGIHDAVETYGRSTCVHKSNSSSVCW